MADNYLEKRYEQLFGGGATDPETGYAISAKKKNTPAALPEAEKINVASLCRNYLKGATDLIVVLGPTASGKTAYAVRLAREIHECLKREGSEAGAEIISADSRQVYRRMDIGTGKDLQEYAEVPYHLIDIAEPGERYNVFEFQQNFKAAYADIRTRGQVPILCGGTGLYINAVCSGYDFRGSSPLSAPKDANAEADPGLPRSPYFIGTLVSREERVRRIDRRLDERLSQGMVEEVRGLLESGVPAERLIAYGLEYKYLTLYIQGKLEYAEMREKLATEIHRFAKRQMTWFRGMQRAGARIHWVEV